MSHPSYDDVVEKDIELVWAIQEKVREYPKFDRFMLKIVSKHPWMDICSIIWLFFVVGLFEIGTHHFFLVAVNLIVAFAARQFLQSKRPIEYDSRLKPMTDIAADSYGFPSLECHMSVVIMGHLYMWSHSWLFLILAIFVTGLVGFSRIFTRSRFPHQVAASWFTGLVGLHAGMLCCDRMSFHTMTKHEHGVCVSLVLVSVLGYFALAIESNDSRLMNVPKQEFVRVIRGIVYPSETESLPPGASPRSPKSPARAITTPRSAAIQQALASGARLGQGDSRTRGKTQPRDSFYFLQRTLQKRDEEKQELRKKISSGNKLSSISFRGGMGAQESSDSDYAKGSYAT